MKQNNHNSDKISEDWFLCENETTDDTELSLSITDSVLTIDKVKVADLDVKKHDRKTHDVLLKIKETESLFKKLRNEKTSRSEKIMRSNSLAKTQDFKVKKR
jgi:hypothetical protein